MSGFACLESVAIGSECFTKGMGVFEMSHCDGLNSVKIGKGSFVHWSGFVLRKLDLLVHTAWRLVS